MMGGSNTYGYVGGNPLRFVDPLGLSQQDVDQAWSWLKTNYPELTDGVTFGPSKLLDYSSGAGAYVPGSDKFYIRESFYTKECRSTDEQWELKNVLIHESLHIYLENKVGMIEYFWNDSSYGYHDWVYTTTDNIQNYWEKGFYWNPDLSPPKSYDPPPINNYPRKPKR